MGPRPRSRRAPALEHAHHLVPVAAHAHPLAARLAQGEDGARHRGPQHGHALAVLTSRSVRKRPLARARRAARCDRRASSPRPRPPRCRPPLSTGRGGSRGSGATATTPGITSPGGLRVAQAQARLRRGPAPGPGARRDAVDPEARDLLQRLAARPFPHRGHRHHRRHPEDHAQDGQARAQLVQEQAPDAEAQRARAGRHQAPAAAPGASSDSMRPSRSRIIRCARRASASLWVTSTIVRPSACRSSRRRAICSPVAESRLPVGSSARRSRGCGDEGPRDRRALRLASRKLRTAGGRPARAGPRARGAPGTRAATPAAAPRVEERRLHVLDARSGGEAGGTTGRRSRCAGCGSRRARRRRGRRRARRRAGIPRAWGGRGRRGGSGASTSRSRRVP